MRYCHARKKSKTADMEYRIYVTDALKIMTENTAKQAGGSLLSVRYVELGKPQDLRTAEEVASDVINKAGLVVV